MFFSSTDYVCFIFVSDCNNLPDGISWKFYFKRIGKHFGSLREDNSSDELKLIDLVV